MTWFENKISKFWFVALCIFAVYAPIFGKRVVRMAGDEKVYVAQAHEMAEGGRWFAQTLFDTPDYYKGPAHFVLSRVGFLIFGDSPWSVLYMNLILILVGAFFFWKLLEYLWPHDLKLRFFMTMFFALNVGCFSHMLVSQMEIELVAGFAVALYALARSDSKKYLYLFWIVAGMVGWFKSPLHSAFLGCAGLVYPILSGNVRRLKEKQTWSAVLLGIAVGFLGYAPIAIVDWDNFYKFYIKKETVNKSSSGQGWSVTLWSTFGFYLFPWAIMAVVAYAKNFLRIKSLWHEELGRKVLSLTLSVVLPSVAFFIYHPYRFENYNIPVISAALLFLALGFREVEQSTLWRRLLLGSMALTALVILFLGAQLYTVNAHFSSANPLPTGWWPAIGLPSVALMMLAAGLLVVGFVRKQGGALVWTALMALPFYFCISLWITMIGEREMIDIRGYIQENPEADLAYYNMDHNIWSEWALLRHWVGKRVTSIHSDSLLRDAVQSGKTVLLAGDSAKAEFIERASQYITRDKIQFIPWKRWRTRPGGVLKAWENRDLSELERDYYLAVFGGSASSGR